MSFAALLVCFPAIAQAQSMKEVMTDGSPGGFSAETNATQTFTYDSNPLRLPTGEQSIVGSTSSPQLILRFKTPMEVLLSDSKVDANFFDRSEYNSVDFHQKFLFGRQNQRWTASLGGAFDYDTTRTSEFTSYGLNLPKVHSTRYGATPGLAYRLNERDALDLGSSAQHVDYDNRAYTDYNYYQLSPAYEHKFDPNNTGTFTLNAQRYETAIGPDSASNSYGPSLGWVSIVNPRLIVRGSAGALATEQEGASKTTGDSKWNFVFAANATYKDAADTLDVSASRVRAPFGNGTENLLNTLAITDRHALNDKLELNGIAKYQSADYAETQPGTTLDDGYVLGGGMAYRIMDDLALTADYTYHNESLTNIGNEVREHVVMLGISLRPSWSGN